jgi:hypothetical protein
VKRFLTLALLIVAAAGCGGEAQDATRTNPGPGARLGLDCKRVGNANAGPIHLCWRPNRNEHGRFVVGSGGDRRALELPAPSPVGHWRWAEVSPDGETILAQWWAECEVPIAYLISISAGALREAVSRVYASRALGWTEDGRAVVRVVESPCSPGAPSPGIYLVDPDGVRNGPFDRVPD